MACVLNQDSWPKIWASAAVAALVLITGVYRAGERPDPSSVRSDSARRRGGEVNVFIENVPVSSMAPAGPLTTASAQPIKTAPGDHVEALLVALDGAGSEDEVLQVRHQAHVYTRYYQTLQPDSRVATTDLRSSATNTLRLAFTAVYCAADARVMELRAAQAPRVRQSWHNLYLDNEAQARQYARVALAQTAPA